MRIPQCIEKIGEIKEKPPPFSGKLCGYARYQLAQHYGNKHKSRIKYSDVHARLSFARTYYVLAISFHGPIKEAYYL